eukprot:CAMPEP_0116827044 /NCGR_PEP_ID=MMETSP0418-20121206/2876_1 /TAXON_ID=1158023 /ORGANISM="Astrosyne radiata, Strain 13vi08-1A" /LENGTH=451 /DNA_ID=CAMNT_0004455767 /DNA_START=230 /DNA_END=1585 /DNA_ORIENTATION=-
MKLARKVFWQSFWYMVAFYATIPFALASYYWRFRRQEDVWVFIMAAFIHPSQGSMNALVYFQRTNKNEFNKLVVKQVQRVSVAVTGLISSVTGRRSSSDKTQSKEAKENSVSTEKGPPEKISMQQQTHSQGGKAVGESSVKKTDSASATGDQRPRQDVPSTEILSSLEFTGTHQEDLVKIHSTTDICADPPGTDSCRAPPSPSRNEHRDLTLAQWVQEEHTHGSRLTSVETLEMSGNFDEAQQKMFEATLEHWRVNFYDGDEDPATASGGSASFRLPRPNGLSNDRKALPASTREGLTLRNALGGTNWLSFRRRLSANGGSPIIEERTTIGGGLEVDEDKPPATQQQQTDAAATGLGSRDHSRSPSNRREKGGRPRSPFASPKTWWRSRKGLDCSNHSRSPVCYGDKKTNSVDVENQSAPAGPLQETDDGPTTRTPTGANPLPPPPPPDSP